MAGFEQMPRFKRWGERGRVGLVGEDAGGKSGGNGEDGAQIGVFDAGHFFEVSQFQEFWLCRVEVKENRRAVGVGGVGDVGDGGVGGGGDGVGDGDGDGDGDGGVGGGVGNLNTGDKLLKMIFRCKVYSEVWYG